MSRRLIAALALVLAVAACAPVTRVFIEFGEPSVAPSVAPSPAPSVQPSPEAIAFSDITVEEVGPDFAVISWGVTPPAQGWIEYGTDTTYGSETKRELSLLDFHRQRVTGLTPETTYHFRVIAFIPATDGTEPVLASQNVTF